MRFELQQVGDEWAVQRDGCELARFDCQQQALADIAARMEAEADPGAPAELGLRFSALPKDS